MIIALSIFSFVLFLLFLRTLQVASDINKTLFYTNLMETELYDILLKDRDDINLSMKEAQSLTKMKELLEPLEMSNALKDKKAIIITVVESLLKGNKI